MLSSMPGSRSGWLGCRTFRRVDTTVQPKNVMFPTDAGLLNRAREILVRLAQGAGIKLRQSYSRVGKFALIKYQAYAHAKQFKRAMKALKTLRTYLGLIIRDIARKTEGSAAVLNESALSRRKCPNRASGSFMAFDIQFRPRFKIWDGPAELRHFRHTRSVQFFEWLRTNPEAPCCVRVARSDL
jgi:hypothetical protein